MRQVAFPVIGEDDLRSLFAEYKLSGSTYRRTVQTTYKASYSNQYRRKILAVPGLDHFRRRRAGRPNPAHQHPRREHH